jgi:shikimate dehydrogenase
MGREKVKNTINLGLIGKKLSHSFSKTYFENRFKNHLEYVVSYQNFEISDITELEKFCKTTALQLNGFNITIPYKESIIPFLDDLSQEAMKIGAVNTVLVEKEKLVGYNTDWYGFVKSLEPFLKKHHQKALILGTGGAAKAVAYGLKALGIAFDFVSRNKTKALSYDKITKEQLSCNLIIINTTPLGMHPNSDSFPMLPYEGFTKDHIAYDLVYNPMETIFLKRATQHGATTINGHNMLVFQADKAWKIWHKTI